MHFVRNYLSVYCFTQKFNQGLPYNTYDEQLCEKRNSVRCNITAGISTYHWFISFPVICNQSDFCWPDLVAVV